MVLGFSKTMIIDKKIVDTNFEEKIKSGTKIHTIRVDPHNRWKTGNTIQCATGVRTKQYNCFYNCKCEYVQEVEIKENDVYVEGKMLNLRETVLLTQNDGFDNPGDFWTWFGPQQPFKGKIIHWTEYKY